jgi:hypothetical protein
MIGAETAQARGLLGVRYGTAQVTVTRPGDSALRDIDDSVWGFMGTVNIPATDRIDFSASVSRRSFEGGGTDIDTAVFLGGVNVALSPLDPVCPFIIGRIGLVDTDPGDTDPLISFGVGVQYDFTEEAALTPSLVFTHVDDYDDVILGLEANYWFNDRIFGIGGLAIGIDDEDIGLMFGAGLEF